LISAVPPVPPWPIRGQQREGEEKDRTYEIQRMVCRERGEAFLQT
jgi:hypothetical protein